MITERFNSVVEIPVTEEIYLTGNLVIPENATGIVIFSHGSGSSRLSPRNKHVATKLQNNKLGTLLFDLLTATEDQEYSTRFDIDLLTDRLVETTNWLLAQPESKNLSVGYFGASTGAASALKAAGRIGKEVKAVVSRGGRPDLALRELPEVTAAVRLIVGSLDQPVIGMNEVAYNALENTVDKDLNIVPGASHLFEEPGKLDEVAELAIQWFEKYLK